jgi:hypothetical protein
VNLVIQEANKAYSLLRSDFQRGNLLLRLLGEPFIDDFSNFSAKDDDFVCTLIDLSEAVEEAQDLQELASIETSLHQAIQELNAHVQEAFRTKDYAQARMALAKLNGLNKKEIELFKRKQELK